MPILRSANPMPQIDPRNTAAMFLQEHDILLGRVADLESRETSLLTQNASLLAEVNMLREELERTDKARIRLQGFSANLTARLDVIQETVAVAMREAAAHGVQPAAPKLTPERDKAEAEEVQDLVARLPQSILPKNKF